MRIAYLSASRIPSRKANAVQVMQMCQAFATLGHQVMLFARPGSETAEDVHAYYGVSRTFDIVWCRRPGIEGLGGLLYGRRVARAVTARPLPEAFYGRDIYSLVAVASLGRPMVFEAHMLPTGIVGKALQRWLFRRKNFSRLVVISRALAQGYRELFPWLEEAVVVVAPSALDATHAHAAAHPQAIDVRQRAGGRTQVGYVGQLYQGKGVELILALARRLPDIDFHLVGGTDELVTYWRNASQDMPNIRFHGHVAPAQTEQFRQAMDVLLAPYQEAVLTEHGSRNIAPWMSPLKLVEYMGSRKSIIASDLAALRETLEHEINALLVPAADVEAWARAVTRLAEDPGLRERLAARACHDARQRFDLRARARAVLHGVAP